MRGTRQKPDDEGPSTSVLFSLALAGLGAMAKLKHCLTIAAPHTHSGTDEIQVGDLASTSNAAEMVLLASFIGIHQRPGREFRYAYGDDAWKCFHRAHTMLQQIPRGRFADYLDVELLLETNRQVHRPDTGLKAGLLRLLAMLVRGRQWDRGGELRSGRGFARPGEFTGAELANLAEAGLGVYLLSGDAARGGQAWIEYPSPIDVRQALQQMLSRLKVELTASDDPIVVAADFQRDLVALHPFPDSNGRTSRALMIRILAEFGLPPPILADQNREISLGREGWRYEVAKGIARSKKLLNSCRGF